MKTIAFLVALIFAAPVVAQAPAAVRDLKLEIPATKYVLKNGLTLIVHEDRKAPIVAVQVWYKVGSRDEPAGKSGFAHLFEHLMFNGTQHADTDWFKPVRALGGTGINGTTNGDRTNYFQTVPTGALDSILWLESDRMGHFIGGVTQAKLDEQRGVVQNERRQSENRPYGRYDELRVKATYPAGHPYAHTTIGSMEDLNAAKLEDVRAWFRDWYGPSNAILVLSGDIAPAEALAKVERAFGDIPPGPPVARHEAWTAKRGGVQREIAYDDVAQPLVTKFWNIPKEGDRDTALLRLAADALTGGKSARLSKRLVHDEQVATSVSAWVDAGEIASQFTISVEIKPEADIAKVEAAIDEELARLMAEGPTRLELDRARTDWAADTARSLERASRKASILIQAESLYGDPKEWRRTFDLAMAASAADVRDAARRWLSDGQYVLTFLPRPALSVAASGVDRTKMPAPAATQPAPLPAFERAKLANGMTLIVAPRREAPVVNFNLSIETGFSAAEAALPAGTAGMVLRLMDEGTTSRTSLQISDELRSLGAQLSVGGGNERAAVSLITLSSTLDPALAIFADVTLNPAFRAEDVERVRKQSIVAVEADRREPGAAGARAMRALMFGPAHPYGRLVTEQSLRAFTRADALAYHRRWIAPENATLIVVGDTTLADIRPKIEKAFAGWTPSKVARLPVPDAPAVKPGFYVVDRPGAAQSRITASVAAPRWSAADEVALTLLNDSFGGNFTSRLNMNLREGKGWSYGARSGFDLSGRGPRLYQMSAPVQTDRTVDSVLEMRREFTELGDARPTSVEELAQSKEALTLAMPGQWETLSSVSGAIDEIVYRGLADDYWSTYAERLKTTSPGEVARVSSSVVRPGELVWVIVGDKEKILPEMAKKGLSPVMVVDADGVVVR